MTLLRGGDCTDVYPAHFPDEPLSAKALADIYFNGKGYSQDAEQTSQPGGRIVVIDVRNSPRGPNGFGTYMGHEVRSPFIAVDPQQLDWENNKGYKGIWPDQPVAFGRTQFPERFNTTDNQVSGHHVTVMFDSQRGTLQVVDGQGTNRPSTNGTSVMTGNLKLPEIPNDTGEHTEDLPYQPSDLEASVRTLDSRASIIPPDMVAGMAQHIRMDPHTPNITRDLLSIGKRFHPDFHPDSPDNPFRSEGFEPYIGLGIEGRQFLFSKIASSGSASRKNVICYSANRDGVAVPHMYYKSNSDGGWRVSPYIYDNGGYNKGDITVLDANGAHLEYGQYTQATKPDESIVALLEEMERHPETVQSMDP